MIQLYFKGDWSNSCSEVPDGTMITVQSKTFDAIYNTLKGMGCSHGAASFAASTNKWETAQERAGTSQLTVIPAKILTLKHLCQGIRGAEPGLS